MTKYESFLHEHGKSLTKQELLLAEKIMHNKILVNLAKTEPAKITYTLSLIIEHLK